MKPNNLPRYIHIGSNHPKSIKDQLPKMINERLVNLSSSESVFIECKSQYQDALNEAGYRENMKHRTEEQKSGKKNRSRNILWFNPPYSKSVKTNIGVKFLTLIDKHFGKCYLKTYFNRKTVKLSYSWMPNMEAIISGHNRKLLKKNNILNVHKVQRQLRPNIQVTLGKNKTRSTNEECNCKKGIKYCPN